MPGLVSLGEVRALVRTALGDEPLQQVVDREEAEVSRRYGVHFVDANTTVQETLEGGGQSLFLRRPLTSVTGLVEDGVTLAPSDYRAWPGQGRLERLPPGAKWGAVITVTYVPGDDNAKRKQALIELVRLAVERTALKSESIAGEYSYQAPEWDADRAKILRQLGFITV